MQIQESKIHLEIPKIKKLDSKAKVFYNPIQVLNRDISVCLLNSIERKSKQPLRVLDLLSASGIRGLRIRKEVPNCQVTLNDYKKDCFKSMVRNAELNGLSYELTESDSQAIQRAQRASLRIANMPAHVLLSRLESYDYIDVDPFGTPVPFLDAAIKRLSPHAILGVTATDTSALCGAAPKACLRKYGSKPLRNEFMHETAVRILIKKCQQVATQYDTALVPIFCHSSNHYVRVYLQKYSSAKKADAVLKQHGYILYCPKCCYRKTSANLLIDSSKCPDCKAKLTPTGPVWLGDLWDEKLVKKMLKNSQNMSPQTIKLLETISQEMNIKTVGFYDLHWLAKRKKWKQVPKIDIVVKKCRGARTHFRLTGVRTIKI